MNKKYFLRSFCFFIATLALNGCSRIDVAVNWADTYIVSQADDYFDLNSAQTKELKEDVKKDIARIRKEKFPGWAQWLRNVEKEVAAGKPFTADKVQKYFDDSLEAGRAIGPYFADTTVRFISTATPEQLGHFEKAVREKNVKDHEKVQNSEKARNESRKKYLRGIETWIDSLTDDQEKLLNSHLNENPFPVDKQLKNKLFILDQFSQARKSPEKLKAFTAKFAKERGDFNDPDYQKALTVYQASLEKFIYQLLQTLTDKQKSRLRESLIEKAEALEKLAAKP